MLVESGRRDHLGAYGNVLIRTPNLDTLAKEGLRFIRPHPESRQKRLDRAHAGADAQAGSGGADGIRERARRLKDLRRNWLNPEGASETELKKRTLANATTSARRGLRTLPG